MIIINPMKYRQKRAYMPLVVLSEQHTQQVQISYMNKPCGSVCTNNKCTTRKQLSLFVEIRLIC